MSSIQCQSAPKAPKARDAQKASEGRMMYASQACGVLRVVGADRVDLLHRLSTQDLRPLRAPNLVAQTLFTTAQGRAIAWVQVISRPDALLVVVPLARVARLMQWIDTYTIMEDVGVVDESELWAAFAVFGPEAAAALGLACWPATHAVQTAFGTEPAGGLLCGLIEALGPGLWGLVPKDLWPDVKAKLQAASASCLSPESQETLRLQAGLPSSRYELAGEPNPLEMRLGHACISWKKGCYIGQEVISRLDSYDKVARLLMGFSTAAALPKSPEAGHKIFADTRPIGKVTSFAPAPGGTMGLALVKRAYAQPGPAQLVIDGATVDINLEDRPFWTTTSP